MLSIKNLHAKVDEKAILKGIDLDIKPGEIHAIMGPNGSGKSTLGHVLAGREGYGVTQGSLTFCGEDLLALAPEDRAAMGIFLSFQYPVEIPGVNNIYFIKAAVNAVRKHQGLVEYDAFDFLNLVKQTLKTLHMDEAMLQRAVNAGFSGGEKKRNEILQMTLLQPKLAILDEIDSGLDIDALRVVAEGINALRSPERSMILITHYQRLLDYVEPDVVHILQGGKIVKTGDKTLARDLEQYGYTEVIASAHATGVV